MYGRRLNPTLHPALNPDPKPQPKRRQTANKRGCAAFVSREKVSTVLTTDPTINTEKYEIRPGLQGYCPFPTPITGEHS